MTDNISSLDMAEADLRTLSSEVSRLVVEYYTSISEREVFPPNFAGKTTGLIQSALPREGTPLSELLSECRTLLDLSRHNGHPRFFGYVASPSTPVGAFADLLASALNANVTGWRSGPAATEIELMVVRWLGQLIGYDDNSKGLMTSGGSMANLIAIMIASRIKAKNVAHSGLWNSGPPLTLYASTEVHLSIPKAVDILGLGREHVRLVKCDDHQRINLSHLRERIVADRDAGLRPFCIVASAGTVSTGAVDPIADVAAIASEFDLWLHVDGAYGAPGSLVDHKRALFSGLELADSVSLDPHKWLYIPLDAGLLLFRNEEAAQLAFSGTDADYIKTHGFSDDAAFAFWDYGVELSRRFRALKVWMTLRYYGTRRIAESVANDIRLAEHLADLIEGADDFELLAPVTLSICCFRYVPARLQSAKTEDLNKLNERLMTLVQQSGRAYLSNAMIDGKFALRICITNFRTTKADLALTLEIIRELANQPDAELPA